MTRAGRRGPRLSVVSLAACFVVWAGSTRMPASAQDAGVPGRIASIEFDSTAPVDRAGLLQMVGLRVGDPFDPERLEAVQRLLMDTRLFSEVSVDAVERADGASVVIRATRKPIVNAVRFRGPTVLSKEDLLREVRLREGLPLTPELVDTATSRLRERYRAEGFPDAQIEVRTVTRAPGEVDVDFKIDPGTPNRVTAIAFEGAAFVPASELDKALGVRVGDRYTRASERVAQRAVLEVLRRHGFYEAQVSLRWQPTTAYEGTLLCRIDPGPRFLLVFEGNTHIDDADLLALLDVAKRPVVTDGTWRELGRRIRQAYQEAGYYETEVQTRFGAAGDTKTVTFAIHEGARLSVAPVVFEGVHGLSAEQLEAVMETGPQQRLRGRSGRFVDDVFDEDLRRIWYLYREHGFESAEIPNAWAAVEGDHVVPHVVVDEGRQTRVGAVLTPDVALVRTVPPLKTRVGEPLAPATVAADREAWETALQAAGYADARVRAEVTTADDGAGPRAVVRLEAEPGLRQRVGAIVVQNNFDTRARVITRQLPFHEGDLLDPAKLLEGQNNLYRLGLFRAVSVRAAEGGGAPDQRDVTVNVSERPPGLLLWSAGYNTRDGLRGALEIANRNLQGLGRRLSLRGELSLDPTTFEPDDYVGNLGFLEPALGDTRWSLRSNVLVQRSTRSVDQYNLERVAGMPALERRYGTLLLGSEVLAERAHVFGVKSDVLAYNPNDEGHFWTVALGPFVVNDGRDDPFVPRRGTYDWVRAKLAPAQFGTSVPLVKFTGQHAQYVPLPFWHDLTFVYGVRGGWARAYAGNDKVGIRDRFFLGGRTTVRGFSENSIGPQGSDGNPIGGDWAANVNTELRFPLVLGFGGVVFVDGGGVYLRDYPQSLHDFRRSAGLGVRYLTPVGPLSLEYGFKLDRRSDESVGELHFSIGSIF